MQRLREVLLETTNKSGVDINHMLQYPHRSAPLQFVCGLGPIKANYFLNVAISRGTKEIKQRNYIFRYEQYCFQEKIFWNASGFIKIEPPKDEMNSDDYKPLDQTRIHPSCKIPFFSYLKLLKIVYGIVRKIEKDTFENISENFTSILDKVFTSMFLYFKFTKGLSLPRIIKRS